MKKLLEQPVKVVVIGDLYVSPEVMEEAVTNSRLDCKEVVKLFWGTYDKEEYAKNQLAIEKNGPDASPYVATLDAELADADVILTHFCPIPRSVMEKAPNLKAILTCRGGVEHIDVNAASDHKIMVMNVIRNAEPVADFVLGLMFSLTRNIVLSHRQIREGKWEKSFYNSDYLMNLNGHVVGLAGVGNVGAALAKRLEALGVTVIAYDAYTTEEKLRTMGLSQIKLVSSLEELFEKSDVLSLHLRLTPETEQMIDASYFKRMKKTAYFINSARGGLVNHRDLLCALQEGTIAGAALDVHEKEPIDKDSGFLQLDNVILTTHIAGTTVDAVPKSPIMLMNEFDQWVDLGTTNRIVNIKML